MCVYACVIMIARDALFSGCVRDQSEPARGERGRWIFAAEKASTHYSTHTARIGQREIDRERERERESERERLRVYLFIWIFLLMEGWID